jgi:hypothetical protein
MDPAGTLTPLVLAATTGAAALLALLGSSDHRRHRVPVRVPPRWGGRIAPMRRVDASASAALGGRRG